MTPETAPATPAVPVPSPSPAKPMRLASIDAYRGLVMFLMMAEVLNLKKVARDLPKSEFWKLLALHQTHVSWIGCSLHDLIQPSFSFLVGVALPFSLAARLAKGQSQLKMTLHAAWRALILVLLGVFLRSVDHTRTSFTFEDTLSQIGFGYVFLFLLGLRPVRDQWIALVVIIVGYWAAFALYPLAPTDFDYKTVGFRTRELGDVLTGFAAHWNKNTNPAWAFDTWFLNLFPREQPFKFNAGGYATLSFIPTLGTMILGLIAGGVLKSERTRMGKIGWLMLAGLISLGLGYAAGHLGICPVVKRIWTPSWILFSGGWCFLFLAAFYALSDAIGWTGWSFPLRVIGMNSIAAYCMADLIRDHFVKKNLQTHFGAETFRLLGQAYEPLLLGGACLLVLWLILFWMYKRKIFLRI
jgi:heparan-alpha-glucosaminide N-acetyltransferase